MAEGDVKVKNNEAEQQFEVEIDGSVALVKYERTGDRVTFIHTEVPKALEGRGLGSQLAHAALEDARAEQLTVVPVCPFISSYIQKHPEYLPLVDPADRARMG